MTQYLSKSKLLSYLQCPRRLYLEVHQPKLADVSESTEVVFATGHRVGELARSFHPAGRLVESQDNLRAAIDETAKLLAAADRQPVFEGTVQHDRTLIRADLLLPARTKWKLVEVKSSTKVESHHLADVAIQRYVLEGTGVPIGRVAVQFINNQFVYPGAGCYREVKKNKEINSIFAQQDVTGETTPLARKEVPIWIKSARATLAGPIPNTTYNCAKPYPCPFIAHCHPETSDYSIDRLPRIGTKAETLRAAGYDDIREIPDGVLTSAIHEWIRTLTIAGRPELRADAAKVLRKLPFPRYYIDFETIIFALPIWKGTRPYRQNPYQWSCHVEDKAGNIRHHEFIDLTGNDPRRSFAESLIATLGTKGPVFVYNQTLEGGVIGELAKAFRDLAPALHAIKDRIVDLLPITRANYYHPEMRGSWGIKAVLPTIAPHLDYANLDEVHDGGQAQLAYVEAIAPDTPRIRKSVIEKGLLQYCARDTEALVVLVRFLLGGRQGTSKAPRRKVSQF